MGEAPAVSSTEEVESGLGALLRVEEELALAIREARDRAREIVDGAETEARDLRERRATDLRSEVEAMEDASRRQHEEELAALEAEHAALVERYRRVRGDRVEGLARWAAERLVAELEREAGPEGPT